MYCMTKYLRSQPSLTAITDITETNMVKEDKRRGNDHGSLERGIFSYKNIEKRKKGLRVRREIEEERGYLWITFGRF